MKKQTAQNALTKEELTGILKKELSNYATKEDLKKELSNYATKEDLKKELSNHPTKDDINQRLNASQNAFRVELEYRFQLMRDDIHAEFTEFKDLIFNLTDPLLKEIETRREDREIATAQMEEVKNHLNNHEKRITELEHS